MTERRGTLDTDLFRHAAFGTAKSQYPDKRYLLKWILRSRFARRRMTEWGINRWFSSSVNRKKWQKCRSPGQMGLFKYPFKQVSYQRQKSRLARKARNR
jgi:hypothetical protein